MSLDELRNDCALKQNKGLHIIMASVIIWILVLCVHLSPLPILTKNLLTFCCTAPLLPISFMISKILKIDFQNKDNPLTGLGVLFSIIIPIVALVLGLTFEPYVLAIVMIGFEVLFCILLSYEVKKIKQTD